MLYRFNLELSDIDRGVYETLDFRVAQHPSEIGPYLLSRTLAYALSYQAGLEFSASGLSDPDAPALLALGQHNAIKTWIEIGNPSAKKLHKAGKAAQKVIIYTYKSPEVLILDIKNNDIHRAEDLEIYSFEPKFLQNLESTLEKNNKWSVLVQQGNLDVNVGHQTISTDIKRSYVR